MITIWNADIFDALKKCPDNYFDGFLADAPYGLEFMGKEFDTFRGNGVDPAFCHWFAGFVDGEGCFSVHKKNVNGYETYDCQFHITLRADDKPILERIHNELGIGTIMDRYSDSMKENNMNPQTRYSVSSQKDCLILRSLFRAFPLRAKKAMDFELWSKALEEWVNHEKGEWSEMSKYRDKLMASRKFQEKGIRINPFQLWNFRWLEEVYRVLKPGAFLLCYGGTRTYHRLTCAIEDAGFEIRDCLMWLQAQGFPKSTDISKQIDKKAGAEREVIGSYTRAMAMHPGNEGVDNWRDSQIDSEGKRIQKEVAITSAATDGAKLWEGYGTALKPSWEPIVLAMKPIEGTFAQNALKWGTGGLNIDDSRINPGELIPGGGNGKANKNGNFAGGAENVGSRPKVEPHSKGRFPANLLLTHHPDCNAICHPDCPIGQLNESVGIKKSGDVAGSTRHTVGGNDVTHGKMKGILGKSFADAGFVSRFFYNGKVSRKERELGLDSLSSKPKTEEYAGRDTRCSVCHKFFLSGSDPCTCDESIHGPKAERMENPEFHNNHPTLKPILLNQYLAKLILPPAGGKLLNAFSGTSSEAIGAYYAGWNEIFCIEKEADYAKIAKARIQYWTKFESYEEALNAKPSKEKFIKGGL